MRLLGLVNVESSRLVVVSLENDLGKHGMRRSDMKKKTRPSEGLARKK